MHDGPLYTILDPDARVHKPGELPGTWTLAYHSATNAKSSNPFEAFPTYSQRYKKARKPMPKLDGIQYGKSSLFLCKRCGQKSLQLTTKSLVPDLFPEELLQFIDGGKAGPEANGHRKSHAKLGLALDGDDAEAEGRGEEGEEEEEDLLDEEQDDDFDEDEDDDNDYNAEAYFDNGEGDGDDDDGEGGGGGGGGYD
jgi:DNA-directed RNA polymerase III subunit RPC7